MIDLAALRAKLSELKGETKSLDQKYLGIPDWDASKPERSTIRILPGPASNSNKFYTETMIHKINGKNLQCPKGQDKKAKCPIHEYINTLWKTENEENIKIARDIKGTKRFYFNAIVRERVVVNSENKEEVRKNDGPLIFSCGIKLFEKIIETIVDPDYEGFLDLKEGFDFRVTKEQKGGYANYDNSKPSRKSCPAGTDEEIANWMNNLHNLDDLVKIASLDDLQNELNIFRGLGETPSASSNTSNTSTATSPSSPNETEASSSHEEESEEPGSDEDFLAELKKIQQGTK